MKTTIIAFALFTIFSSCLVTHRTKTSNLNELSSKALETKVLLNKDRVINFKGGIKKEEFQRLKLQKQIKLSEIARSNGISIESGKMADIQVEFDASFCSNQTVCETEKICIKLDLGYVGDMAYYDWYVIHNNVFYYVGSTTGLDSHVTLQIAKSDFGGTGDYQFYCESFYYSEIPSPHYVEWEYEHTSPEHFEYTPSPCTTNNSSGCSDPCGGIGGFDTRNCFIGTAPQGTTPFIYENNFYYTPLNGNQCPMPGSSFDNVNCFVSKIPINRTGFIWDGNFYLKPICDAPGPNKRIYLKSLMITKDKESGFANGKNDVSFAIAIFPKNSCNNFVANSEVDFLNVGDDDIDHKTWFQTNKELTTNTLTISPNTLVAIIIYEHDVWDNQSWNFNCGSDKIDYKSNNNPFGTIILPYSHFLGNNDMWFLLDGCEVVIGSSDL